MKYMSFPRSCSYTGVANLLEARGIDTTDREMALEIGLPYQLRQEGDTFLAGTMLQTASWFDRFLNPRGVRFTEKEICARELATFLCQQTEPCMLGVELEFGRHAVNFSHAEGDKLVFSNNRHPDSREPDWFAFTPQELLDCVEETVMVGMLEPCARYHPDRAGDRAATAAAFTAYKYALAEIWGRTVPQKQLMDQLNPLFAPLFLDAPIMMDMIGEKGLSLAMVTMRSKFLDALRKAETICLCDVIPTRELLELLDGYQKIMKQ